VLIGLVAIVFEPNCKDRYRMTGDFDDFQNPEDYESYSESTETERIKEEYRASARKNAVRGVVLLFTPILVFIIPFLAPAEYSDQIFIGTLVGTMLLAIIGVVFLALYGVGTMILLKGFDILARISPTEPILARRYAIAKMDDVYLLAHGTSGHLIAIAFREMALPAPDNKIRLPRMFYRWESRIDIAGASMFRREGTFSIPVSQDECIIGDAVLYGAPYQPSRYDWNVPEFTKEQLMAIIEYITDDANRQY